MISSSTASYSPIRRRSVRRSSLRPNMSNRVGESRLACAIFGLRFADTSDKIAIAGRIGGILVLGQERRAAIDHLIEGFGKTVSFRPRAARCRTRLDKGWVDRGAPSPTEG